MKLLLLLLGSILLGQNAQALSVRPRRDIGEQVMGAVIQGAAKIKEALDHGASVKSESKRSIDIFGFKFGGDTGVNAGFGDAANSGASENTDDLVRRRRSLAVLDAARAASLMPQSPFGTNVNIVKISSVSNVNNFGELPPVESAEAAPITTVAPVAARRKRSPDILEMANYERKSFRVDSETSGGKTRKTHQALESIRGSNRVLVKELLQRSKRAPQTADNEEEESSTDQGPPKGRPRGPHGQGRPRGPPPGGCRGGPPPRGPPPEEDEDATATTASSRRKRDTSHSETMKKRPKRAPEPCRAGGGKGPRTTVAPDGEVRRKRSAAASHSSMESGDYSAESESVETKLGSAAASLERRKRQMQGGGGGGGAASGKIGSWFEQMATVFMETVGKVVAATKNAFGHGGQPGM